MYSCCSSCTIYVLLVLLNLLMGRIQVLRKMYGQNTGAAQSVHGKNTNAAQSVGGRIQALFKLYTGRIQMLLLSYTRTEYRVLLMLNTGRLRKNALY